MVVGMELFARNILDLELEERQPIFYPPFVTVKIASEKQPYIPRL